MAPPPLLDGRGGSFFLFEMGLLIDGGLCVLIHLALSCGEVIAKLARYPEVFATECIVAVATLNDYRTSASIRLAVFASPRCTWV